MLVDISCLEQTGVHTELGRQIYYMVPGTERQRCDTEIKVESEVTPCGSMVSTVGV